MRTWTSPGLMCLVVRVLGSTSACKLNTDDPWSSARVSPFGIPAGTTPDAAVDAQNCAQFMFPTDPPDQTAIPCSRDICGVNGIWLGQGVPFRTLNLDGSPNDQGLTIQGFESKSHESLAIGVEGDSLIGVSNSGHLQGTALNGSILTLFLQDPSNGGRTIVHFNIDEVLYTPFIAQCTKNHTCDTRQVPVYRFTATTSEGCNVQLCRPGTNPPDGTRNDLQGDALIFEGDLYNENTFEVTIATMANNPRRTFNIACLGTTISKLHLLRHTSASQSPYVNQIDQPDALKRETLLRMFTGDYCGRGNEPLDPTHPNDPNNSSLFTENGIHIWFTFNSGPYQPTPDSNFLPTSKPNSLDGQWDYTGATCMGVPRLNVSPLSPPNTDVSSLITQTCSSAMHSLQHAPCLQPGTGYVTSYNPPSP